jgi:hypothetical protein
MSVRAGARTGSPGACFTASALAPPAPPTAREEIDAIKRSCALAVSESTLDRLRLGKENHAPRHPRPHVRSRNSRSPSRTSNWENPDGMCYENDVSIASSNGDYDVRRMVTGIKHPAAKANQERSFLRLCVKPK